MGAQDRVGKHTTLSEFLEYLTDERSLCAVSIRVFIVTLTLTILIFNVGVGKMQEK